MVASTFVVESIGTTFNRGFWGGGIRPPRPTMVEFSAIKGGNPSR